MSEWAETSWGAVCRLKYGKSLRNYRQGEGDTRVYGTNGPVGWTTAEPLAKGPRPIVGRKGAYRGVQLAPEAFWVIDTAYWLEPEPDLDAVWAYYKLLTVDINGMDSGSAIPSLTREHFEALPLSLPPLEEQRRIASVLGAFDDLIETNRRLAAEAVSLARAVLSDAGGERTRVGEWAILTRGLSYKGKGLCERGDPAGVPMLNLANFSKEGWLKQSGLKFYSEDYRSRHVLRTYDLLIANTDLTQAREILGRGLLVPPNLNGAIFSHHTSVVLCDDPSLALVLWARLQSDEFRDRAMGFATGTTVTALPKEVLLDFEIRLPREPEVAANRARSLIEQAWGLEEEISDLTRTRDELLPLLMSGRVRVEDVEIPEGAA